MLDFKNGKFFPQSEPLSRSNGCSVVAWTNENSISQKAHGATRIYFFICLRMNMQDEIGWNIQMKTF